MPFFYTLSVHVTVLQPREVNFSVCPPAVSLAATKAIAFAFSSCSYLDVSVHCVFLRMTLTVMDNRHQPVGFPHSDISGSQLTYSSPKHFVVCHVLHRLLVPRHPPYALFNLTSCLSFSPSASLPSLASVLTYLCTLRSSLLQRLAVREKSFAVLINFLLC